MESAKKVNKKMVPRDFKKKRKTSKALLPIGRHANGERGANQRNWAGGLTGAGPPEEKDEWEGQKAYILTLLNIIYINCGHG